MDSISFEFNDNAKEFNPIGFNLNAPQWEAPRLDRVDCLKEENYRPAQIGDKVVKVYTDGSYRKGKSSIGIMIDCGWNREVRISSHRFEFKAMYVDHIVNSVKNMSRESAYSLLTEIAAIKYAVKYIDMYLSRDDVLEIVTDSCISRKLYYGMSFYCGDFSIITGTEIYKELASLFSEVSNVNIIFQRAHSNDQATSYFDFRKKIVYGNYIADSLANCRQPMNMTEEDIVTFENMLLEKDILIYYGSFTQERYKKIEEQRIYEWQLHQEKLRRQQEELRRKEDEQLMYAYLNRIERTNW